MVLNTVGCSFLRAINLNIPKMQVGGKKFHELAMIPPAGYMWYPTVLQCLWADQRWCAPGNINAKDDFT